MPAARSLRTSEKGVTHLMSNVMADPSDQTREFAMMPVADIRIPRKGTHTDDAAGWCWS
jgi:hypothetical protein